MTYDLRRLRLHGIIARTPGSQRYMLTAIGARAAFFYTTLHRRLRQLPMISETFPRPIASPLTAALHQLDNALAHLWNTPQHSVS
jgi:hypothetical protein